MKKLKVDATDANYQRIITAYILENAFTSLQKYPTFKPFFELWSLKTFP